MTNEKQVELENFTYLVDGKKKVIGIISADDEEIVFSFDPKYKEYLLL